jgi:hypothetical protein
LRAIAEVEEDKLLNIVGSNFFGLLLPVKIVEGFFKAA